MTTLTRFGREDMFDTVVFDGGPVWAYVPWYCGLDEGPLGPRNDEFALDVCFRNRMGVCSNKKPEIYDCTRSPDPNAPDCLYDSCAAGTYDKQNFLDDSS